MKRNYNILMLTLLLAFASCSFTTTTFENDQEWLNFLLRLFKEPGEYNFDETAFIFNEQARIFNTQGVYCNAPFRSKDFIKYWNDQKNKCREGIIYKNKK